MRQEAQREAQAGELDVVPDEVHLQEMVERALLPVVALRAQGKGREGKSKNEALCDLSTYLF